MLLCHDPSSQVVKQTYMRLITLLHLNLASRKLSLVVSFAGPRSSTSYLACLGLTPGQLNLQVKKSETLDDE